VEDVTNILEELAASIFHGRSDVSWDAGWFCRKGGGIWLVEQVDWLVRSKK